MISVTPESFIQVTIWLLLCVCPPPPVGRAAFTAFLKSEFSQENIEFWVECEDFKRTPESQMQAKAKQIFKQYVDVDSPNEVRQNPNPELFYCLHIIMVEKEKMLLEAHLANMWNAL